MRKLIYITALIMAFAIILSLTAFAETKNVTLTYDEAYAIVGDVPYSSGSGMDFTFGPGVRVQAERASLQYGSFNLYVFCGGDRTVTFTAPDGWSILSISSICSGSTFPIAETAGDFTRNGKNWKWTAPTDEGETQVVFKGAVTSSGEKFTSGADINITNYYAPDSSKVVEVVLVSGVPVTGDTTMPALWGCLMLVSAASVLVLRKRVR